MKKRFFAVCLAIPLLTGTVAGFLSKDGIAAFAMAEKPPLSPPAWVFPVVWTLLYTLMGISSYLILNADTEEAVKEKAIRVYGLQLVVNFLWPTFFFQFQWYGFSFLWLLLLWGFVLLMMLRFGAIRKAAAYLNILYLLWLTFAAYLNGWLFWKNQL